jgi:hypothetical protein
MLIPAAPAGELNDVLRQTTGVYTDLPAGVVTISYTKGPILGNGEFGVTIGGTHESQTLYMNRVDFGARALGGVTIAAKPGTTSASYRYEQDIRLAEVRGQVTINGNPTEMQSWVAADTPLAVTRLKNVGQAPVTYSARTWTRPNDEKFLPPAGRDAKLPPPVFLPEQTAQAGDVVSAWRQQFTSKGPWTIGRAVLSTRVIGASTLTTKEGQTTFSLAPGREAILLTSVVGDGNLESELLEIERYRRQAIQMVNGIAPDKLQVLSDGRIRWWRAFWEKSWVDLGDKQLNQFWYGCYYALACTSRSGHEAPGLWGTWVTVDETRWGGNKYCNYNFQAPWYGVFSGNRPELALPYAEDLEWYLPHGRVQARNSGYRGATFYRTFGWRGSKGPTPTELPPIAAKKGGLPQQRDVTAFLAINLINHYFYTLDEAFARRFAYPFVKASADFYEDFLVFEDGRYLMYSGAREGGADLNPCAALANVLFTLKGAIEMSEDLGVDADRRVKWRHMINHMSALPTIEFEGKTLLKEAEEYYEGPGGGEPRTGERLICLGGRGDNPVQLECVHPAEAINLGSPERWRQIARNTIEYLNSKPETTKRKLPTWDNYCALPKIFTQAARVGWDADDLHCQLLKKIKKDMHPNLIIHAQWYGGGVEHSGTVEAVNSMLMQSHEGIIRLFPVWPRSKDAKFVTLRAKYAFLVSSELQDGEVHYVKILSEKGRDCIVQNPWPGRAVELQRSDDGSERLAGRTFVIPTKPSETIKLRPALPTGIAP